MNGRNQRKIAAGLIVGYFGLIFMLNSLRASYNRVRLVTEKIRLIVFFSIYIAIYKAFSHDDKSAKLVSQNNEMMAMLVSLTSPVGVELFCCVKTFFCAINLHRCWPSLRKHPFLLALRRWGHFNVPSGEERGETYVFAG